MAKKKAENGAVKASDLQGFKYDQLVSELFETLHDAGTLRDKAGNRELYFDQYAMLMLLYFFNPILTSLRGTQKTTSLAKVQKMCGIRPTSLGSLSEASRVFDPKLLEPIIAELAQRASTGPTSLPKEQALALQGLTAVDGSLLPALPKMAWALWQDAEHRAAKMHVAFAVVPGAPVGVTVTAGNASEREEWRKLIQPGGFYVADRGYVDYSLFKELDADGVRFLVRVQQNAAYEVTEERPLTEADLAAGVVKDVLIRRLGTEQHNALLERPWRIVTVQGSEPGHVWILATNNLTLSAELIAIAYRYRWQIELFFRWLKCVLGCRHLLSHSEEGVTLQVYFAIIASLLIGLWTGTKPNKRLYEMICLYFAGWASAEELSEHIEKNINKQNQPP